MNTAPKSNCWVVLFGGKGREEIIFRMLASNVNIAAVVVPEYRESNLEVCVEKIKKFTNLNIVESSRSNLKKNLEVHSGENLLSIGFPYLLEQEILQLFQVAINIHPTLLPKYKGPNSGAYVILNGEKECGSTVHYMTENIDAGQIIVQKSIPLSRFDTTKSMQRKVYNIEPDLVLKAIEALSQNKIFNDQVTNEGSIFPKRSPKDSEINPNMSLIDLYDSIRSSDPEEYPAFFYIDGQKVCIKIWRPHKNANEYDEI